MDVGFLSLLTRSLLTVLPTPHCLKELHMRTKVLLGAAVVLMLIVSVAAIGSNMGFKIVFSFKPGESNLISLPYCSSYENARSLFRDIPHCESIARLDGASGVIQVYDGKGGTKENFAMFPGEACMVRVRKASTLVVVGSHDPTCSIPLFSSHSNWISVPYHSTATTVGALYRQIPNCLQISFLDPATGTWWSFSGTTQKNDHAVTPGEGLSIQVSQDSTWRPLVY